MSSISSELSFSFVPSVRAQCWGFMVGSTLFAIGTAPFLADSIGPVGANISCFVGSWFFTTAAFLQLALSGSPTVTSDTGPSKGLLAVRALWLAAAVQLLGTILFNISTGEALRLLSVEGQQKLVWGPNADGSTAFLISSAIALIPLMRRRIYWAPRSVDWSATWLNMIGSIAFGVSAVAAIVEPDGTLRDVSAAMMGTFVGAICFFSAAALVLHDSKSGGGA